MGNSVGNHTAINVKNALDEAEAALQYKPRGTYGKGQYCMSVWGTAWKPIRLEPGVSIPCFQLPESDPDNIDWNLSTLWYLIYCDETEQGIETFRELTGVKGEVVLTGGINSWEAKA